MESNMNFKNNNFGNEPPGDGGGGGGFIRPGLTRQGSIYSLTFDEFQSSLGKDFGSMNMDELLKNIWSAEETQAMASGMVPVGGGQDGLQLQRQGSLTLPRTLSQKTVDQVWKDLSNDGNSGAGRTNLSQAQAQAQVQTQRQQTLGEVTLEEFLVRAGVVREEAQIAAKAQIANNNKGGYFGNDTNTSFSVGFQQPSPRPVAGLMGNLGAETTNHLQVQGSSLPLNVNGVRSTYQRPQQQQPIMPKQPGFGYGTQTGQLNSPGIRGGGVMGLGDQSFTNNMGLVQGASAAIPGPLGVGAVSPVTPLSSEGIGKSNGDSSSLSPSPYMFSGGVRGRKSGTVEKVVERRQRRMIKNRESAARSRARKQAYTVELEAEVAKLKEENDKLQRKQAKIMEMQKSQEMEMRNLIQGGPKKRLRRTESGPW